MLKKLTYRYTQNGWHSRTPRHARNDEPRPAFGVPSDATDTKSDDGGEADAFEEEG